MVFGCCVGVDWIASVKLAQLRVAAEIDSSVKRHKNLICEVRKQSQWNPSGARFCAPVQTGSGDHPASSTTVTSLFLRSKATQGWRRPPKPPSAKVKERVELYYYFPSGPSRAALG